jgi:DNA-binding protein HU-beta
MLWRRLLMAKKAVKKPTKVKAAPAKKSEKRYKATPEGTSDRQHLNSIVQAGTGCTAKAAKETMDALIGTITSTLKKNEKLQLVGFGSFSVTKRAARKGRNPSTGEAIRIKASKSVRFKAGQSLKGSV